MNPGYVSALAALAGSAIGALASFATTWMTQHFQDRAQRLSQTATRRERLYGDFIDEASRLLADALTHQLEDASKMVTIYAIRNKLVLFASPGVIAESNQVILKIVELYRTTLADLSEVEHLDKDLVDVLHSFAEACRADLNTVT